MTRSTKDRNQRSNLVPTSEATWEKNAQNISIVIANAGAYLRVTVDEVLGRVERPAEPHLLYTRALWHALTSYFLPDRLTGRTGVEETLHFLRSGAYLPWTPLSAEVLKLLELLGALTPTRAYYSANLKYTETVFWDLTRTTIVQVNWLV